MKEKVSALPKAPGCYLFIDQEEKILYVGKAKELRSRVRSYFSKDVNGKTAIMVSKARDIQYIATRNEVEALLLENRLINEHKPPYNIMLRENRRYAWIVVTDDDWPRIMTARNKRRKGTYYGPYVDGSARRQLVITLNRMFKLRTCRQLPKKVCLQYHIGNCTGPCEGHDTKEEYLARIRDAKNVLAGNAGSLRKRLREQMQDAAAEQRYEQAKHARDMLSGLDAVEQSQVVERDESRDQDVIGSFTDQEEITFAAMQVRSGVIHRKQTYTVPRREDVLEEFITALYRERVPPAEVICSGLEEDRRALLQEYLESRAGGNVVLTVPQRGDKLRLVELANRNAELAISGEDSALKRLEEKLKLPAPPEVIDCFDVSTIQGSETVAACVRYRGGKPDPSGYRHFIISEENRQDDFAALAEAVGRRYREDPVPDLIVIDGGKGQLSAAREAIVERHGNTPIIGLAKREEEVFVPGRSHPLSIDQKDSGLLLLRRIRDATHRFVITHHRSRRRKKATASELDHIQGIGPARKQLLYDRFKTFSRIREASEEQLQDLLGEKTGSNVYNALHDPEA